MTVCFVNLSSEYGGGENQTLLLAKELLRKKVEIVAVVNPRSPLARQFERIGIKTVLAKNPLMGHFSNTLKKISIVHAHDGRAVHWAAIHKAIFKTPFVLTRRVINPLKNSAFTHWSYSSADKIIGISKYICSLISRFTKDPDIRCISDSPVAYPVNTDTIEKVRKSYSPKFIVMQAGTLREHKAFDVSIQAARILASHKDIIFLFLGDGPEKEKLRELARDLKNVEFLGRRSDMGNWFQVSDCLILPSREEGLGSVLLEAMLAGVPVVASNIGGIPDLVKERETGLLVDANDPQALADRILELYSRPELRRFLSENASDFVKALKIERIAEQYMEVYENVLSPNGRSKL